MLFRWYGKILVSGLKKKALKDHPVESRTEYWGFTFDITALLWAHSDFWLFYNLACFNTIVIAPGLSIFTQRQQKSIGCGLLYWLWIEEVLGYLLKLWIWFKYCLVAERQEELFLNDVISNKQLSVKSWVFVVSLFYLYFKSSFFRCVELEVRTNNLIFRDHVLFCGLKHTKLQLCF